MPQTRSASPASSSQTPEARSLVHFQLVKEEQELYPHKYVDPDRYKRGHRDYHPTMLCLTGDWHAVSTRERSAVTCPACCSRLGGEEVSAFRTLMAAHGPLNIEDLDTDPATGYPLALDGQAVLPDVAPTLADVASAYRSKDTAKLDAIISPDLAYLQTPAPVARPWGFTDVVAMAYDEQGPKGKASGWEVKLPGVIWCHYQHGPDLFTLVRIVAQLDPRAKWAGIKSLRPCGFQGKLDDAPTHAENVSRYLDDYFPLAVTMQSHSFADPYGMFRSYRVKPDGTAAFSYQKRGAWHVVKNPYTLALLREVLGIEEEPADFEPEPEPEADNCPHEWVYTGTQYGGEDTSYRGEGRVYCRLCGADGDA